MAVRVRDAWINAILFPLLRPQHYPGSTCMFLKVVVQSLQALGINSVSRILTPVSASSIGIGSEKTGNGDVWRRKADRFCLRVFLLHAASNLFPAPPLSPEHVLMLSSLFCRDINVEEAPHPRERRVPRPGRKTLYCRTMWTDTHINAHINTNNWCWGFYTFTNISPT